MSASSFHLDVIFAIEFDVVLTLSSSKANSILWEACNITHVCPRTHFCFAVNKSIADWLVTQVTILRWIEMPDSLLRHFLTPFTFIRTCMVRQSCYLKKRNRIKLPTKICELVSYSMDRSMFYAWPNVCEPAIQSYSYHKPQQLSMVACPYADSHDNVLV